MSKHVRSPDTTAERLGVSKPTLARWRCDGSGPRFVKIGGKVGYLDEDLDEFLECSRRVSTGQRDRAIR